jgi:chromosome segregation protein
VGPAEAAALTLRAAADRLEVRAELASERVGEVAARHERRLAGARLAVERLAEHERAAAEAADAAEAARARLDAAEAAVRAAEARDGEARAAHRGAADAMRSAAAERAEAERAAERADQADTRARAALARAEAALGAEPDAAGPDSDRVARRAGVAHDRVARWSERAAAARSSAADAEAALHAAEDRRREAASTAASLTPVDGAAGDGPARLGDGLALAHGLERAVAAALGLLLDAPLTPGPAAARAAIAEGTEVALVPAPARARPPAPPRASPLLDAVRDCPDAARPHLERLLADAWLVDGLEDAPDGHPGVFATSDGYALRPADGTVSAARGSWTRRVLRERALEATRRAERDEATAGAAARAAAARRLEAERRLRAAEEGAARAGRVLDAARASARRRAEERGAAAASRDAALGALEMARADGAEALERRTRAEAAHAAAQDDERAAREAANAAEAADRRSRAAGADARRGLTAATLAAEETASRLAAARAAAAEPAGSAPDLAVPERAAAALAAANAALVPRERAAAASLDQAREALAAREAEHAAAEAATTEIEEASAAASSAAQAAEVELARAEERAAEAGPPPDAPLDEPPERLADREAELERRRLALGAVNPLAAAERAELAEREAHLTEQIADLEAAGARLRGHLAGLDAAVAEGFEAIFASVSERFAEVAGLLFPGGEGRLRAVAGEDGESGVEVEVVPAGKRRRSLTLLSGGERSLVALAFCLALAMARPAPFYLMDEVEAALDDVNLRRFLGVVRRLSERTQFVLVTHQQPTVEVADTLFGVTMGPEGASQVLARRLSRSLEGPARPYVRRALGVGVAGR